MFFNPFLISFVTQPFYFSINCHITFQGLFLLLIHLINYYKKNVILIKIIELVFFVVVKQWWVLWDIIYL